MSEPVSGEITEGLFEDAGEASEDDIRRWIGKARQEGYIQGCEEMAAKYSEVSEGLITRSLTREEWERVLMYELLTGAFACRWPNCGYLGHSKKYPHIDDCPCADKETGE